MTTPLPTTKARSLLVVAFEHTVLNDLLTAYDLFQRGQAVSAVQSGTRAYAAGFVGEKTLLGQAFVFNGTKYALMLFLSE